MLTYGHKFEKILLFGHFCKGISQNMTNSFHNTLQTNSVNKIERWWNGMIITQRRRAIDDISNLCEAHA